MKRNSTVLSTTLKATVLMLQSYMSGGGAICSDEVPKDKKNSCISVRETGGVG
jgi:hypothetical protein